MMGSRRVLAALPLAVLLAARPAGAAQVPALQARVNDIAGLLTLDQRAELGKTLSDYEQLSGHQFALLTMPTLDGEAPEPFSMRVVEQWKLGRKGIDDGLLILLVKETHAIRIEVGYGLEGNIPDSLAARIIRNVMAPRFREGDFAGGITKGFELLKTAASGGTVAAPEPAAARDASAGSASGALLGVLMVLCPIGLLLLLFFMVSVWWRRRGYGLGSSSGTPTFPVDSSSSSFGSSSGSDGGGFSGGGGDFGGGGATGSW